MRLMMATLVCTTALAVGACGGPEDTTRDQPVTDAGVGDETADERAGADEGLGDRMGDALTGRRDLPEFIQEAAISSMAEIQLGQLAQKRAQNPQVRKYGQRMVTEHTRALNELKKVASTAGVELPTELDQEHRQIQERLSGLKGPEFDREYMDVMVEAHQDTAELLEDRADQQGRVGTTGDETRPGAATTGVEQRQGEQQASSWASKTLPAVQQHLEQARQLQERVDEGGVTRGPGQTERPAQQP